VIIGGAAPSVGPFNGTFVVISVLRPTVFTYLMTSAPGANASGPVVFGAMWQEGRLLIENNIIELVLSLYPPGGGFATGILVSGGSAVSPYVFEQVVIRGNNIRNVDNGFDSSGSPHGIALSSCQTAIIENNIINLNSSSQTPPYNIWHIQCGPVKYFNTQTPDGRLVQGYNFAAGQSVNELTTDVELEMLRRT